MSELSREARDALERGLSFDGPSAERRTRVKARLMLALGSGSAMLGGAAAAAEAASPFVAGAAVGTVKGLALGSLLVWFGIGAAAGVGVSGVVAVVDRHETSGVAPTALVVRSAPVDGAGMRPRVIAPELKLPPTATAEAAPSPEVAAETPPATKARLASNSSSVAPAPLVANTVPALSVANAPPVAGSSSTLSEEAALLQRAERALVANQPNAVLAVLAEHERRFPAGALREERQAARVLALCELGRTAEARALARTFVSRSPGSVLVPRLTRSCAAPF